MLYSPLYNAEGKCIDDLVLYRFSSENYLLVVNAARTEVDWQWIERQSRSFVGAELIDYGFHAPTVFFPWQIP